MAKSTDRELKRGTLELVLLKLVSERQMYGYELVSSLEQRGGESFQLKEGTLYPVLYRLEKGGFIEARWATLERGVPRKYYRLTGAGAKELDKLTREWNEFSASVSRLLNQKGSAK
jgi:PadR family transcriptional regulator